MRRFNLVIIAVVLSALFLNVCAAHAAAIPLPGPADVQRIKPLKPEQAPPLEEGPGLQAPTGAVGVAPAPEAAKGVQFVLRGVKFENVTAYGDRQLRSMYSAHLGETVTLDLAWDIAANLTARYRKDGYFLSRAFVPAQEVAGGVIVIRAVEGYISDVSVTGDASKSRLVDNAVAAITAERPARLQTLERQLLLLNDIPGMTFKSTLESAQGKENAAQLTLVAHSEKESRTTLGVDNTGSLYLGPYQLSAQWNGNFLPQQETTLSAVSAPFGAELYSFSAAQKALLTTALNLEVYGGYSNAIPGFTLTTLNVNSESKNLGVGLAYNIVRQRLQNLVGRVTFDFRNSNSDVLNSPSVRDRLRTVTVGLTYNSADPDWGQNFLDFQVRRGLEILGSNSARDIDISRPNARPDFMKMQATYTHVHALSTNWVGLVTVSGQVASGSLYSSEEFGFGGVSMGRAYDASEITGDRGIAGIAEFRFNGLPPAGPVALTPYLFYDIGEVWNDNTGQSGHISASSAGAGVAMQAGEGFAANAFAAKPMTKNIDSPLYGGNPKSPRYVFQLNYSF